MALTSRNLLMTVLMILLNTAWIIVTGVTYTIIKDWKSAVVKNIKKTTKEKLKHFMIERFTTRFDQMMDFLSIGLTCGAIIIIILIFRGGWEIYKKVNEKESTETVDIEKGGA